MAVVGEGGDEVEEVLDEGGVAVVSEFSKVDLWEGGEKVKEREVVQVFRYAVVKVLMRFVFNSLIYM